MHHRILIFVAALVVLVLALPLGFMIGEGTFMPLLMIAGGIGALVTLPHHGPLATALVTATLSSAFILPLPGQPRLWEVATLLSYSGLVVMIAFKKWDSFRLDHLRRRLFVLIPVVLYCGWLVALMLIHGVGLNILGSKVMGGRFYLQQAMLALLPACFLMFPLTEKRITTVLLLQFALTITFVLSELVLLYMPAAGAVVFQFLALPIDSIQFAARAETMYGFQRYQSLALLGRGLFLATLVLFPARKFLTPAGLAVGAWLVFLMGVSSLGGSRRILLVLSITLFVVLVAQRVINLQVVLLGLFAGIIVVTPLYLAPEAFPEPVQRTFSVLPGVRVGFNARRDVHLTDGMRNEMRTIGMEMVEQHPWVGRGFGIRREDYNYIRQDTYIGRHIATSNFYSGPLAVLVTCGIPGLTFFLIMMGCGFWLAMKSLRRLRSSRPKGIVSARMNRAAMVVCGLFLGNFVLYMFFTGDAQTAVRLFVPLIGLMLVFEHHLMRREEKEEEVVPEEAEAEEIVAVR